MPFVPETSVQELREELKKLGYLNSGLERWFALDPLSSRTFWAELLMIAAKSSVLLTPFAVLPLILVLVIRNSPLGAGDLLLLTVLYAAFVSALVFFLVIVVSLLIRLRPAIFVERQRLLLAVAAGTAATLVLLLTFWWSGFTRDAVVLERVLFGATVLLLFTVGSYVAYAAFLTFSIHESGRIPQRQQRSRGRWLLLTGAVFFVLFVLPVAVADDDDEVVASSQVPVATTATKLAVIAVDGLSAELAANDPSIAAASLQMLQVDPIRVSSPPELWATIATGVDESLHQVQSLEAIELRTSGRVLQSISTRDPVLALVAPALAIARRVALPPAVRQRDYVWEIAGQRGVPVVAVNWWAAGSTGGVLTSLPQEQIYAAARARSGPNDAAAFALAVDTEASRALLARLSEARLATLYLPALDVILNRLEMSHSRRILLSRQALANVRMVVEQARDAGFEVLLIGVPGASDDGNALLASSFPIDRSASLADVAPTVLDLVGFPRSAEMRGVSRISASTQETIRTYGARVDERTRKTDEEYFENLRSLGYIQ